MENEIALIAIFLFYDHATGKQAPLAFSKLYRHCNVITFDGENWVMIEFDLEGLKTRVLEVSNEPSLIRGLKTIPSLQAMVVASISKRKKSKWFPWWVRSCNEIDRYATGIDIGFTINPRHLLKKLLRYHGNGYEILTHWRRKNGTLLK